LDAMRIDLSQLRFDITFSGRHSLVESFVVVNSRMRQGEDSIR